MVGRWWCSHFPHAILGVTAAVCVIGLWTALPGAQGLGGAGTVQGVVKDPTGGVMQAVTLTISNPVSGFKRETTTDGAGRFTFGNLPPNSYHIAVEVQGFQRFEQDVSVRTGVPIELTLTLQLAGTTTEVQVVGHTEDLLERDPTPHTDIDQSMVDKLPSGSMGLNQVVTMASPGVVADSNGFFHPVGDHAQTQFSIDNQPVTDQQSRIYSNQISTDAVQSMEVSTGVAPAEYGDKSSLVVRIVTKSGLDQSKPAGSVSFDYGSFGSPTIEANIGAGSHTIGNFLSISGMRTDRFLDPPEFTALHDTGDKESIFDRLDVRLSDTDTLHLNMNLGRSSFDVPNTYDAQNQDQRQTIDTLNIAPGYSRVIGTKALLTANGYIRSDHLTYSPSPDPFDDTPATVSQDRSLANVGGKVDLTYTSGANNVKMGGSVSATKLDENFTLGFTDPAFNSPCVDANGNPVGNPALRGPGQCLGALSPNPGFNAGLVAYDLTRGGSPFVFNGTATIKEQAAYIQDDIKAGRFSLKLGVRFDNYDGLATASMVEPRLGASYSVPGTNTILRASFGRSLETPYNENLLLSSGYGASGALVGTSQPLQPGRRNEGELGAQQMIGRWVVVDAGYFNKHTINAYDFNVLFNTPIVFPVAWDHSRINGFTGKINLVEHRGFSAFMVMGHTNAIFSPPGVGGVLLSQPPGDFRIDHDQKFESTTNFQYAFNKAIGAWLALSWRYDSGTVAGSVPDYAAALALTPDQQAAIGLYCGNTFATISAPITSCSSPTRGATRVIIPADGTENDVTNPPRIAPRNLFDLGLGIDNLLHADKSRPRIRVRFTVVNLTNTEALYNFLSTFSGTHFVTPRAYEVQVGVVF
jgi:Carboxypeptidase regulatory-like domain